eukprot:21457-Heterococcus_DN1.PRE.2
MMHSVKLAKAQPLPWSVASVASKNVVQRDFWQRFHCLRAAGFICTMLAIANNHHTMFGACAMRLQQLRSTHCCRTSTHIPLVLPHLQQARRTA